MNLPLKRGDVEPAIASITTGTLVTVEKRTDPSTYVVRAPNGKRYVAIVEPRLVVIGEAT